MIEQVSVVFVPIIGWCFCRCLWISRIEEVKKKLEDEDKRNEASGGCGPDGGGGGADGVDMEVEPWTTGTGEEPDNPFSKRSTRQKGHGKSKVTFENFEYIKVRSRRFSGYLYMIDC